jgi:hypothetical protein
VSVADVAAKLLDPESPWPLAVLVLVLVVAGGVFRRQQTTLRRFGARVGVLETSLQLETTRRRQVEEELRADGYRLPFWPLDGAVPAAPALTSHELRLPPVPDRAEAARHSR